MAHGDQNRLVALFERVIPFRFLSRAEKQALASKLHRCVFEAGESLMAQGAATDADVYLIEQGSVSVVDRSGPAERVVDVIVAGHYVGEWEPLFEVPRAYEVRADDRVVAFRLSRHHFLELLQSSRAFAQALATILRDRQQIFSAFDAFQVELSRGMNQGYINITRLLPLYVRLQPALHPYVTDDDRIDIGALMYAVRRLPENIGRTFAFLLTDELPVAYRGPEANFTGIATAARRRDIWEMLPGKNLVLLRSGDSDLVDLVSCMCLYAVEARKLRHRLASAEVLGRMQELTAGRVTERRLLEELPLSVSEREGLIAIWPEDTVRRLYEVTLHREMFSIHVRRQTQNYANRRMDLWTAQVADATHRLLGYQPSALPAGCRVHVVSSNTHSVTNCLNPWFQEERDRIIEWAHRTDHPLAREAWPCREDQAYAVARDYFRACPEEAEKSRQAESRSGILRLRETVSTGIQVQLIDCEALLDHEIDPQVARSRRREATSDDPGGDESVSSHTIVVNIDYAFGQQAEHVIRNLLLLFGERLASVNFFGKAGALVGSRGDILVPTAFIEQRTDEFLPLPDESDAAAPQLQARVPASTVHRGPLLTVDGTLLQNRLMLHFYRHLWGCLGMEMEGAHYYKQVLESSRIGVVPRDLPLRCLYYVSDLPLEHGAELTRPLEAVEGIPPLYGITRHILSEILD